jgi:hypothetical protein
MNDQSSMFDPTTSEPISNATSLPGSVDGLTPFVSPPGPTIVQSGPAPAPASPFRSPASRKAKRTKGTSGPPGSHSSVPSGPLSSWENRLRQQLEQVGSTECLLTWREKVTPAGRSLSQLVPLTRLIEEIECGLWPTPTSLSPARNGNNEAGNSAGLVAIRNHALWATPTSRDHFPAHTPEYIAEKKAQGHGMSNLNDMVALWATPCTRDWKSDRSKKSSEEIYGSKGRPLPRQVMEAGEITLGSPELTEKPGALNPAFVCWLMGFPPEWDACAPTAMPSSRKSRLS